MQTDITCREVIDAIVDNEIDLFGKDGMTEEQIRHVIKSPNWLDVVCMADGGKLSGYAFAKAKSITWRRNKEVSVSRGKIWLARLCVLPEYRGNGLGSQMLGWITHTHDELPTEGADIIEYKCYVPESMTHGQIWMRNKGWKAVSIDRKHYHDAEAYVFRKTASI